MSQIDIQSLRQSAHEMIERWGTASGGTSIGYLVRNGDQRACTMARMEYTPRERGLFADKTSRIRISAIGLDVPPNHELDTILYDGEELNILLPVEGARVGASFIYYDCNVVFTNLEGVS